MANSGGGSDIVQVPPGAYSISGSAIAITKGMQIVGIGGAAATTVQQGSAGIGILQATTAASDLTVSGLTLMNGHDPTGGAINSAAPRLTLTNDVFANNGPSTAGQQGAGGAVAALSSDPTTLIVTGSTFTTNRAGTDGTATVSSGQGGGGAIQFQSPGTLTVSDSTFTNNRAGGNGGTGTTSAQGTGGAIGIRATTPGTSVSAEITRSAFSGNHAGGNGNSDNSGTGSGGAIGMVAGSAGSSLKITDSVFSENAAGGDGGFGASSGTGSGGGVAALDLGGGKLTVDISGSTFAGNHAGGTGGSGGGSAQGEGGALQVNSNGAGSALTLTDSTFDANVTGGPLGGGGGSAGFGHGGTISSANAAISTSLINDTVTGGVANGTSGDGGNIEAGGPVFLKNTIVAGGSAAIGANCAGTVTSFGHNIEDANSCALTAAGDHPGTDPKLAALANNGGPVPTRALLAGSPALDGGDLAGCPATDGRGVLRPAGAGCDIGAFEVATPGATTGAANTIHATSALLRGVAFNPDLAGATATFQYGTTTAYGSTSTPQPVGPTTRALDFTTAVKGLKKRTTYHFRLVVTNALGTATGTDQTFTTTGGAVVSNLRLKPSRIVAAPGRGASFTRAKKRKTGTTLSWHASEPGTTTFTVQKPRNGFRSGRRCVAKRPRGKAKARRCKLFKSVGSFKSKTATGTNKLHFTGRVKRRPLRPGSYRLLAVESDTDGAKGKSTTRGFRVIG
jgi:hypothetical protein